MKLRFPILFLIAGLAILIAGLALPRAAESPIPERKLDPTEPRMEPEPIRPLTLEQERAWVNYVYSMRRSESPLPNDDPSLNVIYGDDNRKDYYDITDPGLIEASDAVCLVVHTSELTDNGDGTYTLAATPWTFQSGYTLCPDERFRGQLEAGFCTGFLVGPDILATAGHCISSSTCGTRAFVFGFRKNDSLTTAPTVYDADDIYFCSGIIDQVLSGDVDHAVLQLDRPVVGRAPLYIRRTGLVSNGDPLAVIGHPSAIPLKAAGGAIVRNNLGTTPYFQANLDTYGGNSGSPVFNLNNYVVEGILVRGAPDFVYDPVGACTRSNVVPNTGNTGTGLTFEEVSKTTQFEASIPVLLFPAGVILLDRSVYGCDDVIGIEMRDSDLMGNLSDSAIVTSSGGDIETVTLLETEAGSGIFEGSITTGTGAPIADNGLLEIAHGETIVATYYDADNGTGSPDTDADTATIDCSAPIITSVTVVDIIGTEVWIGFDTDELATGTVHYGTSCGTVSQSASGPESVLSHLIVLSGLLSSTDYFFSVSAIDEGENTGSDDNGGQCYTFTTEEQLDHFTEQFTDTDNDLDNLTVTFIPNGSTEYYLACVEPATEFPTDPTGSTQLSLSDDAFSQVFLSGVPPVSLFGTAYISFFVGSNGYVTFDSGDSDYTESLDEHFGSLPRISALYDDLDPEAGGTVSYLQLPDRVVVTFENIPEHSATNSNSFQIEMFANGKIAITYLGIAADDGLAGLSRGEGVPAGFVESDLSAYGSCPCDDADWDGICDVDDNCPNDPNPLQENDDTDTLGNACDNCPETANNDQADGDSDTVGDECDNCPQEPNTLQEDIDADSVGNVCDNCPYFTNPDQIGCIYHGDPEPDGVLDIVDAAKIVDVAFRNRAPIIDASCPHAPAGRTDLDCDGDTDVLDVIALINIALRNAPNTICNPCECNPYPDNCP
jgi:hypothetical protein